MLNPTIMKSNTEMKGFKIFPKLFKKNGTLLFKILYICGDLICYNYALFLFVVPQVQCVKEILSCVHTAELRIERGSVQDCTMRTHS